MTSSQNILWTVAYSLATWTRLNRSSKKSGRYEPFYAGQIAANQSLLTVHLKNQPRKFRLEIGRVIREVLQRGTVNGGAK